MNIRMFPIAAFTVSAILIGCAGNKPETKAQENAVNRGVKLEKEECEEKVFEGGIRASGIGQSQKESFAKNLSALDARTNLAARVETLLKGYIKSYDAQYGRSADVDEKAQEEEKGLVDQVLQGSTPICSNPYAQTDGSFKVYTTVELKEPIETLKKALSKNEKLRVDFEEHLFNQEMAKELEDYRNNH